MQGVLADDLTGAMDAGVGLLSSGIDPVVVVDPGVPTLPLEGNDLIVIDTESRNVDVHLAADRVRCALAGLSRQRASLIYKKVDSTLRGHVAAELQAVLSSTSFATIMLAPALPAMGRTTRGGIHLVSGVPLAESEYAHDDLSPIGSSRLDSFLPVGFLEKTRQLTLEDVRGSHLPRLLEREVNAGTLAVLCDAVDDSDLSRIGRGWRGLPADLRDRCLPVGSAGLFGHLFELPAAVAAVAGGSRGFAVRPPILVISASPSAVSKTQIRRVEKNGSHAVVFRAPPGDVPAALGPEVIGALSSGRNVVVDGAGGPRSSDGRGRSAEEERAEAHRIVDRLSEILESAVSVAGALVLFGGDTALAVCRRCGIGALRLVGQLEPYVPVGRVLGGRRDGMPVVTKAGGFGSEGLLETLFSSLPD